MTGGFDGHTAQSTTEILKPGADAWVFGPILPVFRSAFAGVNLNGVVYVSGGVDRHNKVHDEVREKDAIKGSFWVILGVG